MYTRRVHVDDSSNIDTVDYNPEDKVMRITFVRGGGTYIFEKVPALSFGELISAPSVGKYFQANIKGNFPTARIGK